MWRMALPRVIPALADLTQDIAGPLPVQLLQDWATGAQDLTAAESLLGGFEREGTVVSTDTSGLSRMTQAMDLLDVINVISKPKEIIHALGCAVGGRAIGTWVADNSEMIYPASVDPEAVLDAMGEVQHRIQERMQVRIGMCIHPGRFFEIGGGLYGHDADLVEFLAENCAGGGQILLTGAAARALPSLRPADLEQKAFPGAHEPAWLIRASRRRPDLEERETLYPHPYPQEFYSLLPGLDRPDAAPELKDRIYSRWLRDRVVVFIALEKTEEEARSLTTLLDALVGNALMETVVRDTAPSGAIASSGGGLAICTFERATEALQFSRDVQARLSTNGLPAKVALDAGPVLLFQNNHGPSGITGSPVNIASKLSEDIGQPGKISITTRVADLLGKKETGDPFEVRISGVVLTGLLLG